MNLRSSSKSCRQNSSDSIELTDMKPLAEQLRPSKLPEVVGQEHVLGEGQFLRSIIESNQPTSLILWGPPGTGETTLARIMGRAWNAEFIELSAVTSGLADVRKVIEEARGNQRMELRTLLFVDEIHRFNKAQQDAFLPHVESGLITLIGATTENPSFEVIGALQSRARVVTLKPLGKEDLGKVIKKAAKTAKFKIAPKAIDLLADLSQGDARVALNTLESASKLATGSIKPEHIKQAVQRTNIAYDKNGEQHYDIISAFIKSMRGSNEEAATYYLQRMLQAGEDPKFIARRIVIFASEDIGMASPHALTLAVAAFQAIERIGLPEGEYALTHAAVAMCQAKKNRDIADTLATSKQMAAQHPNAQVPMHLRNAPTKLMKELGYGDGYKMGVDFQPEADFLPEEIS